MTTEVEAIHTDASMSADSENSIADQFLDRISGEDRSGVSSEVDDEETVATDSEGDADSEDRESVSDDDAEADVSESESEDVAEDKPTKRELSDDDVFTHEVDGETVTFSIADAKRELGRKKAFARKEQEVAALRAQTETTLAMAESTLKRSYENAREAYKQYEGVDLHILAMREGWDVDTLEAVKESEKKAWANVNHYHTELAQFASQKQATEKARIEREAQECMVELRDPQTGIKDFSLDKYNTILNYAETELGFDPYFVRNVTNPKMIKALNLLYDLVQGQHAGARALETKTRKAAEPAKPLKVLKSSTENTRVAGSNADRSAMDRLKRDNSSENIQAAFLARITSKR